MKIEQWFIVGATLLFLSGCQTMKSQYAGSQSRDTTPQFLNANETYNLFSNKTVESVSTSSGITSFTYYNPNGELIQHRFWTERRGDWRVLDSGEICLTMEGRDESCRMMAVKPGSLWAGTKDRYYKYRTTSDTPKMVVRYRQFIEGNSL